MPRWVERFGPPSNVECYRFDLCTYGTRWRKRSRIATNTCLAGRRQFCTCGGKPHLRLAGRSALHGLSWTRVAQTCPRALCCALAQAISIKTGWLASNSQASFQSARCGACRLPGEATQPGPRRLLPFWVRPRTLFRFRPRTSRDGVVPLPCSAVGGLTTSSLLEPFGLLPTRFRPCIPFRLFNLCGLFKLLTLQNLNV